MSAFEPGQVVLVYDSSEGACAKNLQLFRVLAPFSWADIRTRVETVDALTGSEDDDPEEWYPERRWIAWMVHAGLIELVDHVVFDPGSGSWTDGVFISDPPEPGNTGIKAWRL